MHLYITFIVESIITVARSFRGRSISFLYNIFIQVVFLKHIFIQVVLLIDILVWIKKKLIQNLMYC